MGGDGLRDSSLDIRYKNLKKLQSVLKDRMRGLCKHTVENKYSFSFDNTKILKTENNWETRGFVKMIHIEQNQNAIYHRLDIMGLNDIYPFITQKTEGTLTGEEKTRTYV